MREFRGSRTILAGIAGAVLGSVAEALINRTAGTTLSLVVSEKVFGMVQIRISL